MSKNVQDYSTRKLLRVYFRARRKALRAEQDKIHYYRAGNELSYGLAKVDKHDALKVATDCELELLRRNVDISPSV